MALAILMWAVQLLAWTAVLVMHFALVAQQSTTVCETWELLATLGWAFVWAVVLIHMLSVDRQISFCAMAQNNERQRDYG